MVDVTYILLMIVAIVVIVVLIVVLRYIEYKQSIAQKEKPPDPFVKAFIITLMVAFFVVGGEAFGVFQKGDTAKFWWAYIIIFVVFSLLYLGVLKTRVPMSLDEQIVKMDKEVYKIYKGSEYGGYTNFLPLDTYRTTAEFGRANVGNILKTYNINGPIQFLAQWDKETKELLTLNPYPSANIKNRLLEKVLSRQKDVFAEAFGVEGNEVEKEKVNA